MSEHEEHATIERFERFWIGISLALIAVFIVLVFYAVHTHGGHIGRAESRAPVDEIMAREVFAEPGLRELAPGQYQLGMVAQAFSFVPDQVEVDAGAEVEFLLASRDVMHGFQIKGTTVNVEMIPGEVARLRYTFDEPGEYRIICNQYCGIAHHDMTATIVVRGEDDEVPEAVVREEEDVDPREQMLADGERVYQRNCQACHGRDGSGTPGTFPPLAGHAPDLLAAEGGRDYLVDVTLYGLGGEIEVKGRTYRGVMPGFDRLDDEQIAAMLNYTATAWGNEDALPEDFTLYEPEEVRARRDQGLSANDMNDRRQTLELD